MKYITVLLLFLAISFGCKKKDLVWESDWAAPLVNDTLSLENLVNDSTLAANGGFYELNLRRLLFDLNINDLLTIPDTTIEQNFTIAISSFVANPGFTFVSSTEEHEINIPDLELKKISLSKGYIDVQVLNPIPTTAIFEVTLPGVTKDGVTFSETYSAPPGTDANPGIVNKTIDLTGYSLDLTGSTGTASNRLMSVVKVSTSTSGPTVTITDQQVTKVVATFRDVEVFYAKGYFGNKVIEESDTVNLDLLNSYQSGLFDIGTTNLKFIIDNGIKVSANAKLKGLTSYNNLNASLDLIHPLVHSNLVVNPASGYWNTLTPSETVIEANSGNSNIENFIENLGNKYKVDYRVELNPWGNVSGSSDEYFPNSKFRIFLEANMPLAFGMDDLVLQDTFDIDLDQGDNAVKIKSGKLILNAANSFPLSANVDLFLMDENNVQVAHITSSEPLQSGLFGSVEAPYSLKTAHSEIEFMLDNATVEKLDQIKHVVVRARMNTIDPVTSTSQQIQIPEHAFLSLKIRSEFKTSNTL